MYTLFVYLRVCTRSVYIYVFSCFRISTRNTRSYISSVICTRTYGSEYTNILMYCRPCTYTHICVWVCIYIFMVYICKYIHACIHAMIQHMIYAKTLFDSYAQINANVARKYLHMCITIHHIQPVCIPARIEWQCLHILICVLCVSVCIMYMRIACHHIHICASVC